MSAITRISGYFGSWLSSDLVAGITLAAYAIPVSLAYATLAGLPPQVGVYGYLMGGLGYASGWFFPISRHWSHLSNLADDRRHCRRYGRW